MGILSTLPRTITMYAALQWMTLKETQSISSSSDIKGKRLVQPFYCTNQILAEDHRYRSSQVRSKLECVGLCQQDGNCQSIVFDKDSLLCHLGDAVATDNCSNMEPPASSALTFYQEPPPCGEAEVMGPLGLCICAPGFTGVPCQRYFHDCTDVFQYGNWHGSDIYTVSPLHASAPFQVACRRITSVRTYILDRRKNSENFTRHWADYRNGFGVLTDDYWIGLEKIHALTVDRDQELRVNIKIYNSTNYVLSYYNFYVSDESSGYRLYFNTSLLNRTDDCLSPLHGAKFSTYDRDRDGVSGFNCAAKRKGGFWFRGENCGACSPLGIIYQPANGTRLGLEDEAFWDSVLNETALFKVSMYLIPFVP